MLKKRLAVAIAGIALVVMALACNGDPSPGEGYPIEENATCLHEGEYVVKNGVGLLCTRTSSKPPRLRWKKAPKPEHPDHGNVQTHK